MKPCPEGAAQGARADFNAHLSHTRIHVEHAFGRLKGCWRRIIKRNNQTQNVKNVVCVCVVLHNFCKNAECGLPGAPAGSA